MNQKIQKIVTEIEKVKSKIATQQARLRELEQQKTELENTEIVGMVRGLEATDTGSPIMMPVGQATLGRIWNVLGEPVDGKPMPDIKEWMPIHRPAPAYDELTTTTEIFETGIKSIDLIEPFIKGGKTGLFGGAGVVENDLRKHTIRSAANTEIHVVAYLAGDDHCVRPLRGKNKVYAERPSLPCDSGQLVFNLCHQLLPFVISSGLVQHLRHLVTGEHQPGKSLPRGLVVGVQVFALRFFQPLFAALQNRRELV